MRALAAAALCLFLTMQGHAQTAAINMEGLKIMPSPEDIRSVAPDLERYAKEVVIGDV